jgi:hypothetical protein
MHLISDPFALRHHEPRLKRRNQFDKVVYFDQYSTHINKNCYKSGAIVRLRLEWRDKQSFALSSHKSKAIERLEWINDVKIKDDPEFFSSQVSIRTAISAVLGAGSVLPMK